MAIMMYVNISIDPSNQLLRWFDNTKDTMNVDSRYKYTCMGGKRSVMSLPVIQPTTTTIGKTKRAICTDEPNATFNIYIY